ncbi:DoxX family protein [Methylobacterium sp. J-076]|uniref:DoxX family protein n=1 Tax=Methylobacterium sp. J-076 TaxID=2836655 RepID=UPI001FBACA48|nr:DoxX family protein [Methylobacterium sp. J-076]MCJ2015171.1 DoxX family protein [Methylobacterium sp. J-076]
MTWLDLIAVPLLAKICLVSMFPLSAYDKIVHWGEAMDQAKSGPLPFPALLLILGIAVEAITPALIVIGLCDRAAAFVLAGFCVITALMYHQFWKFPRFWSRNGQGRTHLWDFFKNFGLVGGLLLVVIGGSYAPVLHVVAHPLSNGPTSAPSILDRR